MSFTQRVRNGLSRRFRKFKSLSWGKIPRYIFGNDSGLRNNIKPFFYMTKCREAFKLANPSFEQTPEGLALYKNEFVTLGKCFDPKLIKTIQNKYLLQIEDPEYAVHTSFTYLKNPMLSIPEIKELLTPELTNTIQTYFSSFFKIASVSAWRIAHEPTAQDKIDLYSNTWHTDHFPTYGIKLFLILSDRVTKETGAFSYHDLTTGGQILRSAGFKYRSNIVGKAHDLLYSDNIRYFEGELGDTLLANPHRILHRAGTPAPGTHRDMLSFYIVPKEKQQPDDWYTANDLIFN